MDEYEALSKRLVRLNKYIHAVSNIIAPHHQEEFWEKATELFCLFHRKDHEQIIKLYGEHSETSVGFWAVGMIAESFEEENLESWAERLAKKFDAAASDSFKEQFGDRQ